MTRRRSMRGGLADVRWLSVYTIYKYTYIWLKCWLPWPGSTWWKSVALVRNHFAASSLGARGFNWWAHTTWCQQSPLLGFLSVLCAFPGGEMNKRDCRRFSPPGHYFYERVFFFTFYFFSIRELMAAEDVGLTSRCGFLGFVLWFCVFNTVDKLQTAPSNSSAAMKMKILEAYRNIKPPIVVRYPMFEFLTSLIIWMYQI